MKNKQPVPAPSKLNLLRQIYNFIPEFLVAMIARDTQVTENPVWQLPPTQDSTKRPQ